MGFLAFAEGTNNWLSAVFGPQADQKLHKKEIFVPSAGQMEYGAVQ
jgi:hypothetical protein